MAVTGWKLDRASREFLVDIFPPRWRDLVADHITFDTQASLSDPVPPKSEAAVIGHADDGDGLEALVVSIAGNCSRPDGSIFHITCLSIATEDGGPSKATLFWPIMGGIRSRFPLL